jgi:hypothetical protein
MSTAAESSSREKKMRVASELTGGCPSLGSGKRPSSGKRNPASTAAESSGRGKKMRVAAALTGVAALAMAGTMPTATAAYAGTNGQKVRICGLIPPSFSVYLTGYNQNGVLTKTGWRRAFPNSCWAFTNYWWRGSLYIFYRSTADGSTYVQWRSVPKSASGNWVTYSV